MPIPRVNPFSYQVGDSILHRIDVRFKLIFVFVLSALLIRAELRSTCLLGAVLIGLALHGRYPLTQSWALMPGLPLILPLIIAARGVTGPTDLYLWRLPVSWTGLADGGLICLKLLIVILLGGLFSFATKITEIKAGMEWLVRPLPYLKAQQIAVMVGLMVRFMPAMLDQAEAIRLAQEARGVSGRRNPLVRMRLLASALMRRLVLEADRLTLAMEARAYTGERTEPEFCLTAVSWQALLVVLSLSLALIWL